MNEFIIKYLKENTDISDRDIRIVSHILSGGKTDNSELGESGKSTVSATCAKYLPFLEFDRTKGENGIKKHKINAEKAPQWLIEGGFFAAKKAPEMPQNIAHVQICDITEKETYLEKINDLERIILQRDATIKQHENSIAQIKQSIATTENQYKQLYSKKDSEFNAKNEAFLAVQNELQKEIALYKTENENLTAANQLTTAEIEKLQKEFEVKEKGLAENLKAANEKANSNENRISEISEKLNEIVKQSEIDKNLYNENLVAKKAEIEVLQSAIEKDLAKRKSIEMYAKKGVSILMVAGCLALSVLAIENMFIMFNAVAYPYPSFVLSVLMEGLLWAVNFVALTELSENEEVAKSSKWISYMVLTFRFISTTLGSYSIASKAVGVAAKFDITKGFFVDLDVRFTDISTIYFGQDLGNGSIILTTVIISIMLTLIELFALKIAIPLFYTLFLKAK
jgi:hypothetical protein